jgi:hypothetical protein
MILKICKLDLTGPNSITLAECWRCQFVEPKDSDSLLIDLFNSKNELLQTITVVPPSTVYFLEEGHTVDTIRLNSDFEKRKRIWKNSDKSKYQGEEDEDN